MAPDSNLITLVRGEPVVVGRVFPFKDYLVYGARIMKITKKYLNKIIREETEKTVEESVPKYRDQEGNIYKARKRTIGTGGHSPEKIEAAIKSGQIPAKDAKYWRNRAAGGGGTLQLCDGSGCNVWEISTDKEFYAKLREMECISEPNCIKI